MEANQQAPESATGTIDDHRPKDTPTAATPDSTEQRRTDQEPDSSPDSFEQGASYGNFANLAEEFEARAKSREHVNALNSRSEEDKPDDEPQSLDFRIDDKSLREHLDPEVDDANAAGGVKIDAEPAGDRAATALEEGENDTRSKADRFRAKIHVGSETLLDKVTSSVNKGAEVFGPRPTGQETRTPHGGPGVGEAPYSGIDPGTAAAGMLAMGILGSELIGKIRKARGRDTE